MPAINKDHADELKRLELPPAHMFIDRWSSPYDNWEGSEMVARSPERKSLFLWLHERQTAKSDATPRALLHTISL